MDHYSTFGDTPSKFFQSSWFIPEQALAHSGELCRLSGTCAGHQHMFAQLRRSASIGAHMPFTPPHMLASQPGLKIVVHPAGIAIPTTSSCSWASWTFSTISAL